MAYSIASKIEILAGAIRSRARECGIDYLTADQDVLGRVFENQVHIAPDTIASQFYMNCTDRQWTRVINKVRRSQR